MKTIAWHGDWRRRIRERISEKGFLGVGAFLASIPARPYRQVAKELGEDIAVMQLINLQFSEGKTKDDLRLAAIDCLTRELTEWLPTGWPPEISPLQSSSEGESNLFIGSPIVSLSEDNENGSFRLAGAYGTWITAVSQASAAMKPLAEAAWIALVNSRPPNGWLPTNIRDALLICAFERGWPSTHPL